MILHRFSKRSLTVARIHRAVRCYANQRIGKQIHGTLNKNQRLTITFFKCLNSIFTYFQIEIFWLEVSNLNALKQLNFILSSARIREHQPGADFI